MQTTTKNDRARVRRNIRALVRGETVRLDRIAVWVWIGCLNDRPCIRFGGNGEGCVPLREIIRAIKEGEPV